MKTLDLYRKFRQTRAAKWALNDAKTLEQWDALESAGLVRLRAEPEQESYYDVYGEPSGYVNAQGHDVSAEQERKEICDVIDRQGCWCVLSEFWNGACWAMADCVGMCVYNNPLSPFENDYVPQLMRAAIDLIPQDGQH